MIKDYVLTIAAAGIITAIAEAVLPAGGLGRTVKLTLALFMIVTLISPLKGALSKLPDVKVGTAVSMKANQKIKDGAYSDELKAEIIKGIKSTAQAAAGDGVSVLDCCVKSENDGNIFLTSIVLLNRQPQSVERAKIEKVLKERFGGSISIKWSGS